MNKALIPIIVIVLLVLAGGGAYLYKSGKLSPKSSDDSMMMDDENNSENESMTESTSLKDLLTMGKSQKCTFSDPDSGSTGTTYIASGKVRADATVNSGGQQVTSHMISDGQTVYVWTDDSQDGFKMAMNESEPEGSTMPESSPSEVQNEAVDINKKIDYNCSAWSQDSSMFNLPESINFMDFESVMQGSMMNH